MSEIKFKRYGELDISEGLAESSHVIIEENGDVKRFPANSIGKVKTVNGAEPDENGNVAIEISGGSASSWEELGSVYTDDEPVVLVENAETYVARASTMSFYARGEITVDFTALGVDPNELGTLKVVFDGTEYTLTSCGTITYGGEFNGFGYGNGSLINNAYSGNISDSSDTGELLGIVLKSNAVYLCMDDDYIGTHTLSLTYYGITETITQVPEKYIPTPSIAPVKININPGSDIYRIGGEACNNSSDFVEKVQAYYNNGHRLSGGLYYYDEKFDNEFEYVIFDAVPDSYYTVYAYAMRHGSYIPLIIKINSSCLVIYKPDGTEEYRKDYEEE